MGANGHSPFPKWLRRLDPILAEADSNVPYRLFRDRRLGPRSGLFVLRRRWKAWKPVQAFLEWLYRPLRVGWVLFREAFWMFLPLVLVVLFFLRGFSFFSLMLLVLCLALVPWLARGAQGLMSPERMWLRPRRAGSSVLPVRLSHALSPVRYHEQACLDLWLAGFTAREVAEALYLEHRERTWWRPLFTAPVVPALFLVWLHSREAYRHVGGVVLMLWVAWIGWEYTAHQVVAGIRYSTRRLLQRFGHWVGAHDLFRTDYVIDAGRPEGIRYVIPFAVLALPFFFGTLALHLESDLGEGGVWWRYGAWIGGWAGAGAGALLLRWRRQAIRETFLRAFRRLLLRSEWPYHHFMSFVVARDPAGAEWAWKSFGTRPLHSLMHSEGWAGGLPNSNRGSGGGPGNPGAPARRDSFSGGWA